MNKAEIPVAQRETLSLLLDDHSRVKKIFKDFSREKRAEAREALAHEACLVLTIHAQIEEELFYPFLRAQNPASLGRLLDEAVVEHASTKALIAQIQHMNADDALFLAKVTVLGEYIAHHLDEEEGELFPKVVVLKIDLRELAAPMLQRKEELAEQLMPHMDGLAGQILPRKDDLPVEAHAA